MSQRQSHIVANNYLIEMRQFAYSQIAKQVRGDVLEMGVSSREGILTLLPQVQSYTIISRNACDFETEDLHNVEFHTLPYPPFPLVDAGRFDCVICFHALEKIKDDFLALREIHRMLRPEGKLIVVATNQQMMLTRNPFNERNYSADELKNLISCYFSQVEGEGIFGSDRIMQYYEHNKRRVESLIGFDFLLLHRWLPNRLLRLPYRFLDRLNRLRLLISNRKLVSSITLADYTLGDATPDCLEFIFTGIKRDQR